MNWHEIILDRITGLGGFCFSQLGVLGKFCSESKLLPQRLAFGHRCILKCPIYEAKLKMDFYQVQIWNGDW